MATFDDTLHEIAAAAHAAGLLSGSGQVDIGQAESALLHALRQLSQTIDIDGFKRSVDPLLQTSENQHTYALPADFGRLTLPDDEHDTGLFIYDVATEGNASELHLMELADMLQRRDTASARPTHFALTNGNQLRLFPTPDAGPDDLSYRVAGVYIISMSVRAFEDDVPLPDHSYLRDATLAHMAVQLGHPRADILSKLALNSFSNLVNTHLRLAQAFQYKHARRYSRARAGGRH